MEIMKIKLVECVWWVCGRPENSSPNHWGGSSGVQRLLPSENSGPLVARSLPLFFNENPEIQFLYEISWFWNLGNILKYFKNCVVQTKLICRLYSATGCQIETSVLDNILMDEDNSFIACDHPSWEFPTGMNWVQFFPCN